MLASYLSTNSSSLSGESAPSGHSSATHSFDGSHKTFAQPAHSENSQPSMSSYNSSNGSGGGSTISAQTDMTGLGDLMISFSDPAVPPPAIPPLQQEDKNIIGVEYVSSSSAQIVKELAPQSSLKNFAPSIDMLSINSVNFSQLNDVSPMTNFYCLNNLTSSVKKGVSPLWSTAPPAASASTKSAPQATDSHRDVNFVPFHDAGYVDELYEQQMNDSSNGGGGLQSLYDDGAFHTVNGFLTSSDSINSSDMLAPAPAVDMLPIAPAAIVRVTAIQKLDHTIWTIPPSLDDGTLEKIAGRFAILGAHGCYLSVRAITSHIAFLGSITAYPVCCDQPTCDTPAERWTMYRVFRGNKWLVAFRNVHSRGFLSIHDNRACLYANHRNDLMKLEPWELFEVIPQPDVGMIALKSMKNSRYLCVVAPGDGKLKKNKHDHGGEAICNRKEIKEWEQFTLYHII